MENTVILFLYDNTMKVKARFIHTILMPAYLTLATFFLHSCGQMSIPSEMIGQWKTDKSLITVRTKNEKTRFEFTSDSAIIKFKVNSDHTVDGSIGSAKFENGKIKTNWLLPIKMSGIAFTIECGKIGKIFENDPLDSKEVELWLSPALSKGTLLMQNFVTLKGGNISQWQD